MNPSAIKLTLVKGEATKPPVSSTPEVVNAIKGRGGKAKE
jgi:hypothetical protein